MGEKDDQAWEIETADIASHCSWSDSDFFLPSIRRQRSTTSYGSFSQEFRLDTETLQYLLAILDDRKAEPTPDSGLNCAESGRRVCGSSSHLASHPNESESSAYFSPPADLYQGAASGEEHQEEILRQQKLGHRPKDSGIDAECYFVCSNPVEWSSIYLAECNKQFELLWSLANARLDEFEDSHPKHHVTGACHFGFQMFNNTQGSIQADMEEKKSLLGSEDVESIGGDSGLEEDHLVAMKGYLEQLHSTVIGVKNNVEASVQRLSEFVMQHDHLVHSDKGERLLLKHHVQHEALLNRLANFITDIDSELVLAKGSECRRAYEKETEYEHVFRRAKKFRPGYVMLLSFLLLMITCVVVGALSYKQTNQSVIFMRLVRSPLFIALYFFMYGTNLMVWARNGINYVSIFGYPSKGIPTPKLAFQIASFLSVCFCSLVSAYFLLDGNYLYIADKVVATLQWLLLLGLLINPIKMLIRPGRFAFILVWIRVLFSPFPKVPFGDFWFADQLNSMVPLLVDFEYFICYSATRSWLGEKTSLDQCSTNGYYIRPIISCLPSLWRFNQCLRCFYDTRQIKHLINAGKYFTTFPVVAFAVVFSEKAKSDLTWYNLNWNKTGWIIICWFVSSLIHALYCFIWDVTQDWGLFRFHKRTLLRPTLLYRSKCVYALVIVFDFIVRFLCAIKLTLIVVYNLDSDLFYTGLVIAEITRRFVWNFFRVEYEQVMINHKLDAL